MELPRESYFFWLDFYKDLTKSKFGLGEMLKSYAIILHTQARAIQVSKIVFFADQDAFLKSAENKRRTTLKVCKSSQKINVYGPGARWQIVL